VSLTEHRSSQTPARLGPALFLIALAGWLSPVRAAENDIRRDAAVNAIEKVLPSVVNIATEEVIEYHDVYDEMLRQFFGWSRSPVRQQKSRSLGSGVIIDEDGYVLTNFHVVRRANRIQVKLWNGREYEAEALVATPGTDVALLRIKAKPGEKFTAIKLAPDDDLLLGETVLALGNPYGLGGSVTKGILSAKNRRSAPGDEPLDYEDWLQTDAAINPGNSGGPLVNLRGELIGLNIAVFREQNTGERGPGVGFSVPVKQVSAALSHFLTPEVMASLCFGAQFKAGAAPLVVAAVQTGGPAAKAGLAEGDKVLEIDAKTPRSLIEGVRLIGQAPKQKPRLVIERGHDRRDLSVQLLSFDELVRQKLGLTFQALTPQAAERLGIPPGDAVLIDQIEKGSPADQAQLQRGYLVLAIDGQSTPSLRTFADVLAGKKTGDTVSLQVRITTRPDPRFIQYRQQVFELGVR
jgi:serine protease Do